MSSNFMPCINEKIKSFCKTKHSTEKQANKMQKKNGQWINDDKNVYIHEHLAYKLICYINLGLIEADEFTKSLGVENDK